MKSSGSIRALIASSRKSFGTRRRTLPVPLVEPIGRPAPGLRPPLGMFEFLPFFKQRKKSPRESGAGLGSEGQKPFEPPRGLGTCCCRSMYLLLQHHQVPYYILSYPSSFLSSFFLSSLNIIREPLCERDTWAPSSNLFNAN